MMTKPGNFTGHRFSSTLEQNRGRNQINLEYAMPGPCGPACLLAQSSSTALLISSSFSIKWSSSLASSRRSPGASAEKSPGEVPNDS